MYEPSPAAPYVPAEPGWHNYGRGASGTAWAPPPAAAAPTYSPPPTVRAPSFGTDWGAVASAFTAGLWGGAAQERRPPTSAFSATPAFLEKQQEAALASLRATSDFQKDLAEQNAKAAAAVLAAASGAVDWFGRPLPVVIDPGSDVFRLQVGTAQDRPGGGLLSSRWVLLAAGGTAAALLGWRWLRRRKVAPS